MHIRRIIRYDEERTKNSDDFKKLYAVKQDRNVYKNILAGDKVKSEKTDQASQSVYRKVKFEDCRFDQISRKYHLKELKKLLPSDPVLKTIYLKLTGSLREPIYAPKPTPNVMEVLRRVINLLIEARFTAGTFNAQTLLDCSQN